MPVIVFVCVCVFRLCEGAVRCIPREGPEIEIKKKLIPVCSWEKQEEEEEEAKKAEKNCWNRKNTVPQLLLSCKINNQTSESRRKSSPSLRPSCARSGV